MKQNVQATETAMKIRVLDDSELSFVSGGVADDGGASDECSCTVSPCHRDGVTDGD